MGESRMLQIFIINFFLLATQLHGSNAQARKAYIVYMGDAPKPVDGNHHQNLLSSVIADANLAQRSRIYSYTKSFNALAANLLPHEAEKLKENPNVISVFPSTLYKLHTTRSWDFLGMPLSVNRNQKESDVIVGVLDTGIYIDAPSFNGKGFGPPPPKWKGVCRPATNFTGCNNKVIGARAYDLNRRETNPNPSPADDEGHGSHTSSTVAGVPVADASLYGLGKGTARGGVPSARIAVYKVCWADGCSDMDMLAAFDDAIQDGVDLLSISIGSSARDYFSDVIAIGSYHAMKNGILTACSAGNSGPYLNTVANVAPWIFTVAASGTDKQYRTPFKVGNVITSSGLSINTFVPKKQMYPLISGAKAANLSAGPLFGDPSNCDDGTLDASKVRGKIVLCSTNQDDVIKTLGGAGMIISNGEFPDTGFLFNVPAVVVTDLESVKIDTYINSTRKPRAVIYQSISVNVTAPFVASFSSRGPNPLSRVVLKPDITAPGVDILAAFTKLQSLNADPLDDRFDAFTIISGTSMACPHVAAAAAYVKSFHPNWSPAAIKSALMTTANELKVKEERAELAYGAGHIDPIKALEPGLVYDMSKIDYVRFLCSEGYTGTPLRLITTEYTNCSSIPRQKGYDALNYPSMQVKLENFNSTVSAVFHRRVTNVGPLKTVYKATVVAPNGLTVTVVPDTLAFDRLYEKKPFKVIVKGPPLTESLLSAAVIWSDNIHTVRTPILVYLQSALV